MPDRLASALPTPNRQALESVTRLTARLLRVHGATVTAIRGDRLAFLSAAGPAFPDGPPRPRPANETPCAMVAVSERPLFLEDATRDEAFRALPLAQAFAIGAYASIPLIPEGGQSIGTLSVFDADPRTWTAEDRATLTDLAGIAAAELGRLAAVTALDASNTLLVSVIEGITDPIFVKDQEGRYLLVNSALANVMGSTRQEILGLHDERFFLPDEARLLRSQDAEILATGRTMTFEQRHVLQGVPREYLIVKGPYRDVAGRTIGIFGIARDVTERRQMEHALRRSEELHRLAAEVTREAIWYEDLGDKIIHRGEGYQKIFGYLESEITTDEQWWFDRVHPHDQQRVRQYYDALPHANVQDSEIQYDWRRADGRYAPVVDHVRILRDESGRPRRVVGALQDVTERVQTGRELARSLSLLEATLESTTDGLLVVSLEGEIQGYNRRFAELWRIPPEVLRSGRDNDALAWAVDAVVDAEQFLGTVREIYEHPAAETFDSLLLKDGRVFERYSQPQRLGSAITGRVWSFRDVTARREAENRLEQSRLQYQQLVHSINGIVWELNPVEGTFTFVSPQAEQLTGLPVSTWLEPGSWERHIHPDDRDRAAAYSLLESKAGRDHAFEYRLFTADERTLWVRNFVNVEATAGASPLLRGVMVDITEFKRTEEALRQREDQLRHSQKLEAVGRLAGGIAHDFNNLLTAIVGYSDLLRDALAGDPRSAEIEEIRRAGDRATQLTRQLLAFSRKQVLQPTDVQLQEVVLGLASLLRRVIGEQIRLETVLSGTPAWTHADRGQLEQVIINLAVNGRDAMPRGGVLTIMVAAGEADERADADPRTPQAPPVVQLVIRDTGIGMDDATRAHIFEPFFTTKEVGQGTGLGLATVYGIVRQSGGDIHVESAPGAGTTFYIQLPQVAAPAPAAGVRHTNGRAQRGTERILLIEDEPAVRRLAGSVLRGLGYEVIEAGSGPAAIGIARQRSAPIHLVLSDMVMPGLSGTETRDALTPILPETRYLFMSGYPVAELDRTGVRLPARQLLQKPFTPEQLARRVRETLDEADGAQPTPSQ